VLEGALEGVLEGRSQGHLYIDGIDVTVTFYLTSIVPTDFQLPEIVGRGVGRVGSGIGVGIFDNMGPHSGGGTDANHSEAVSGKKPGHCLGQMLTSDLSRLGLWFICEKSRRVSWAFFVTYIAALVGKLAQ
jgi:hypothetical protein